MRKLLIISALFLASTAANAQSMDIGSLMSGSGVDQQQIGQMMQGAKGMAGGQRGARGGAAQQQQQQQQQAAQGGDGQGQPQAQNQGQGQKQAKRRGGSRESRDEARAREIAGKYGVSW